MWVIEIKLVADDHGLVSKAGHVLLFENEEQARDFGIKNIEGSKFIASWQAIEKEKAIGLGYKIK